MTDTLEGKWEGLMHDIEGYDGRLLLEFGKDGRGKLAFTMTGDHCEEEERIGEAKGELDREGNVRMYVSGGEIAPMEFAGNFYPVKVHAEAAITGCFTDSQSSEPRGGVAIFWRYNVKD